jgi:phosphoglycerate dehydrogenase-like enzyme
MDLSCDESFNKTIGIIGLGSIGMDIAEKCKKLGMRVVGLKRNPVESEWIDQCYSNNGLEKLLNESDFVVIATPLTTDTIKMIGEKELKCMKKTAVLINIARGGIVDEEALQRALEEKVIAGAGLDVTDPEPLPQDSPLWDMPNVIITPHIAAHSPYYMDRAEVIKRNMERFTKDQELLYEVDKNRGY